MASLGSSLSPLVSLAFLPSYILLWTSPPTTERDQTSSMYTNETKSLCLHCSVMYRNLLFHYAPFLASICYEAAPICHDLVVLLIFPGPARCFLFSISVPYVGLIFCELCTKNQIYNVPVMCEVSLAFDWERRLAWLAPKGMPLPWSSTFCINVTKPPGSRHRGRPFFLFFLYGSVLGARVFRELDYALRQAAKPP